MSVIGGLALVAAMLVCFGGYAGPVGLLVVMSLAVMAAIMSIGIYLAPTAAILNLSAVLALVSRSRRGEAVSSAVPRPSPGA